MKIPVTLKHKPVIVAEDYDGIDGRGAGESEAKGLSLGLAQWNDRGKVDISVKVWRHTGGKWSRQSEELPIHRVLDMTMLVVKAKQYFAESYRIPNLYDPNAPGIGNLDVQGGRSPLKVCVENPMIGEDIKLFLAALTEDDELLSERLRILKNALIDAGY